MRLIKIMRLILYELSRINIDYQRFPNKLSIEH
jgi:hypothetical protein